MFLVEKPNLFRILKNLRIKLESVRYLRGRVKIVFSFRIVTPVSMESI